eukprot:CAMPEP_0179288536 /NCGR_PEP_ID=MMETSP0797-20121207/40834_1 /TAXON_ID=47934 /ORGANISM="Dinophysis acuminata, Strain DAEP01" /LENGTH=119 /DNA_ID=CAMNT_0020997507 /DNA_START=33 /DNA_END=388 /DNA_ORIENTATION=+
MVAQHPVPAKPRQSEREAGPTACVGVSGAPCRAWRLGARMGAPARGGGGASRTALALRGVWQSSSGSNSLSTRRSGKEAPFVEDFSKTPMPRVVHPGRAALHARAWAQAPEFAAPLRPG